LALREVDAAAAAHGFVSREQTVNRPRRRRIAVAEPTRHLAIRLPESQYNRFVLYADRLKLTYHDALRQLLDQVGYSKGQPAISPRYAVIADRVSDILQPRNLLGLLGLPVQVVSALGPPSTSCGALLYAAILPPCRSHIDRLSEMVE